MWAREKCYSNDSHVFKFFPSNMPKNTWYIIKVFYIDLSVDNIIRSSLSYKNHTIGYCLTCERMFYQLLEIFSWPMSEKYTKKALTKLIRSSPQDSHTSSPSASAMGLGKILSNLHTCRMHPVSRYPVATMCLAKPPHHTQAVTSSHCHMLCSALCPRLPWTTLEDQA